MQVGAGPPFQNPPLSGILGAPSAPPFGPRGGTWRSREDGLRRPGGALASSDALAAPPPSRGAAMLAAGSRQRGQSLTEFALVAPVLLFLLFGVLEGSLL